MLLGQFKEIAALNDADIIGGDFNASTYREREKAKLNSIEEASEETLLIPAPDLIHTRGLGRLLQLHTNKKKERTELARCRTSKSPT